MSTPWYGPDPARGITSEYGWRDWDGDARPDHLHDGWDAAFGPEEPVTIPVGGTYIGSGQSETGGFWTGYQLSPILRWFAHRLTRAGRGAPNPGPRDIVGYTGKRGTAATMGRLWDGGLAKWSKGVSHTHQRFEMLLGGTWTKINPRDPRVATELERIRDEQTPITLEEDMPRLIISDNGAGATGQIVYTDGIAEWSVTSTAAEAYALGRACGFLDAGGSDDKAVRAAVKAKGGALSHWEFEVVRKRVQAIQAYRGYGKPDPKAVEEKVSENAGKTLGATTAESVAVGREVLAAVKAIQVGGVDAGKLADAVAGKIKAPTVAQIVEGVSGWFRRP